MHRDRQAAGCGVERDGERKEGSGREREREIHLIAHNVQCGQIANDIIRILALLLGGVRVVKAHNEFPLVPLRVVLVQQRRLAVADVHLGI